jgi:hypothetical protein
MNARADVYRKKAAAYQAAAGRNPEKAKELLGLATNLQFVANVAENGLPEAKQAQRLRPQQIEEKA